MTSDRQPVQQTATLRERLTRMSEASLRASGSLDFDTVLNEAVESACTLTDARYGGIALFDESGAFQAFVTAGLTDQEREAFLNIPAGRSSWSS